MFPRCWFTRRKQVFALLEVAPHPQAADFGLVSRQLALLGLES
ncbi:MAG: hypothetical protein ABI910_03245 [Gemmatimonadota bacterium]